MLNCCWCEHSIISAVTHKLNVSGHAIWTPLFLFWYVELVPKVFPHISVTLYMQMENWLVDRKGRNKLPIHAVTSTDDGASKCVILFDVQFRA
jgi:hypothetical protein